VSPFRKLVPETVISKYKANQLTLMYLQALLQQETGYGQKKLVVS